MIKNFDITFKDFDGTQILENEKPLTMKNLLVTACGATFPHENLTDGDEKFKRFLLGIKISKGGDIELTPEEIVLLKKLTGFGYPPLLVGQIYETLNA